MSAGSRVGRAMVVVGLLAASSPVTADHIGVLQLNQEPAGSYAVSAWTQPGTIRARDAGTVTVAVMRPHTRVALTDVVVHVTASRNGSPTVSSEATLAGDPLGLRYVADLRLPEPGRWTINLAVQGPAGSAAVAFPLDVEPRGWTAWGWWGLGVVAVGVLVAAALRRWVRPGAVAPGPDARGRTAR
jgi:hypothetical protein